MSVISKTSQSGSPNSSSDQPGAKQFVLRGLEGVDVTAEVIEVGSGIPVVFLHGLVGLNEHWEGVAARISSRARPVMLELPLLALEGDDCSITGATELATRFLEQFLGGQPSVLVGNSFGGHIAVKIAINRPDLVKGLVLAGASGLIEKSMVSDIQIRPSREWLARKIGELFHDRSKMNPSDVERAHAVLSQRGGARAMVKLSRTARKNHVGDQLALVKAPTLILWGRHDIVTPPEAAEQFAARIPRNKLVWLETCGHAPMIECPEEFGAALNAFLDEVS